MVDQRGDGLGPGPEPRGLCKVLVWREASVLASLGCSGHDGGWLERVGWRSGVRVTVVRTVSTYLVLPRYKRQVS